MSVQDIITAPPLTTIARGVTVQKPLAEAVAAAVGPLGGVSIGPGHIEGVGGVIHVAVHHPDGTTLALTLGRNGYIEFATLMNAAARAVVSGAHEQPETRQ